MQWLFSLASSETQLAEKCVLLEQLAGKMDLNTQNHDEGHFGRNLSLQLNVLD